MFRGSLNNHPYEMGFLGTRVYVGGINCNGMTANIGERDLFKIFLKFGPILETVVSTGYG